MTHPYLDHVYNGIGYPLDQEIVGGWRDGGRVVWGQVQWDRPETISGAFHVEDTYVRRRAGGEQAVAVLHNGERGGAEGKWAIVALDDLEAA